MIVEQAADGARPALLGEQRSRAVGDEAPGRASVRVRRSSRSGRSISSTRSRMPRNISATITRASLARSRSAIDDLVPERAQQLGGTVSSAPRTSGERPAAGAAREPVASAIRSRPGRRRPPRRTAAGREALGVARRGAAHDVEHHGGVEHRPGQRAERRSSACRPRRAARAARGRAAAEPNRSAAGGRDADRARAVGGERAGDEARPRRRPPSRRSSRPACASRSHGLRVTPHVIDSVNGHRPSSGIVVLPTMTAPAARSRRTTSASAAARVANAPVPRLVTSPAMSISSLTATGTPSSGASRRPASRRSRRSPPPAPARGRRRRGVEARVERVDPRARARRGRATTAAPPHQVGLRRNPREGQVRIEHRPTLSGH